MIGSTKWPCVEEASRVSPHKATYEGRMALFRVDSWPCAEGRTSAAPALAAAAGTSTRVLVDSASLLRRAARDLRQQAGFALVEDEVDDPSSPYFAQYATLRYGLMRASDTIAWCDWLPDRLESSSSPHPRAGLNRA